MNHVRYLFGVWIAVCGIVALACAKKLEHRRGRLRASGTESVEWTELGQCSRSCGGGVAYRERICSKSTDSLCEPKRKYFLCNTQDCPHGSEDFRDVQCGQFDSMEFEGVRYEWISYYGENQCALNCIAKGKQFYRRLADKVVDGTPCDRNTLNVCIDGTCQSVGCDRVLGSKRVFDACLICGGYGATCRTLHGTIETQDMKSGYSQLILLPQGATSITIQEEGTSKNYFAVRNVDGVYYLNGNFEIGVAEPLNLGRTFFEYRRLYYGMEYLSAVGPLQEPLIIEIIKQPGIAPSVKYDYSVLYNASSEQMYAWIAQAWSQCNASCGIGYLNREVSCINLATKRAVDVEFCHDMQKPSSVQVCHRIKCSAEWYIGVWQACSETCGNSGTQVRQVFCNKTVQGEHAEVVSEDQCPKPKPEVIRSCDHEVPCAEWEAGSWSQCAGSCGSSGEQIRTVICIETGKMSNILPDRNCDLHQRPSGRRSCELDPCLSSEWMVSEWSGCGDGCSGTVEIRQLKCSTKDGHLHPFSDCDREKRPETTRPCPLDESCGLDHHHHPQWFTSQWSSCSVSCGTGTQSRSVFCGSYASGHVTRMPFRHCDAETKLDEEQECSGSECSYIWFTGPFGKCSAACGGGQKQRELFCFIGSESVDPQYCDDGSKPDVLLDCNLIACDEDNFLLSGVSDCSRSRHGCCPDQLTAAEGPDYLGCASDPIPPGLCIDTEFGCCPDGITAASGPFQNGCYIPHCLKTRYGCCADGETPAPGLDGKGCGEYENDLPFSCQQSLFGCCPDGVTARTGVDGKGCGKKAKDFDDESSGSGFIAECELSVYGCCPNSRTTSGGPNHQGCHGYSKEKSDRIDDLGASTESHISPAQFTDFTRSASSSFTHDTEFSTSTEPEVVRNTSRAYHHATQTFTDFTLSTSKPEHATSINSVTERIPRDNRQAVDCHKSIHGCCSDGKTPAAGPNQHGCPAERDPYMDTCEFTSYGCCPDGVTPALGPNHAHCPHLLRKAVTCTLSKDPGPCSDYSLKWSFDSTFGNCISFEYGGCGGNENRFETSVACRQSCINPEGIERCYLAHSPGRCYRSLIRYYYNPQTSKCEEFIYGGCLGNENRFSTVRDCETSCIEPQKPDVCNQPSQMGPCRASIPSYYFDHKAGSCRQFIYGGCSGNDNRFKSLDACDDRCGESLVQNCRLPRDPGPCSAQFYQWYFSSETGQCEEFKYGGCLGNANRFRTKMDCEKSCKRLLRKTVTDRCSLSSDTGSCRGFFQSWYYDQSDGYCKEFVYGGCGGNENRFESETVCRKACDANHPIDVCTLPAETGRCRASFEKYYFDSEANQCLRFVYGGCDGNGNNFQSLEECQQKCSSHITRTLPPGSNRCVLPRDPGPCVESMLRWHYSPLDRRCVKFEYGGCGGNRNRFLSESVCNHQCGFLALMTTTSTTQLPRAVDTSAPAVQHHVFSTVLHKYDSVASTAPNPVHVPDVDWDESEVIPWPEEESEATLSPTKELHREDNFVSSVQPDSDSKWLVFTESPLPDHHLSGTPMSLGSTAETVHSKIFDVVVVDETHKQEQKEEAPIDYGKEDFYDGMKEESSGDFPHASIADDILFSHTSPTSVTVLNACSLHADHGACKNYTYWRWNYDQEIGECIQFKFGGCDGNANNFETKEGCESRCPVKDICLLAREVGSCPAAKRRYFFDMVSGVCQQFIYGGCNGNANRFLTLENCQRVCETLHSTKAMESKPEVVSKVMILTTTPSTNLPVDHDDENSCNLPKDIGPCRGYLPSYYFDHERHACLVFGWGGCGGNANRFDTTEECGKKCFHGKKSFASVLPSTVVETSTSPETSTTLAITTRHVAGPGLRHWDICKMHKDPGPCENYRAVWYFEPIGRHCRRFYYGGCGGNDNKYNSSEECHSRCLDFESSINIPVIPQEISAIQSATTSTTTVAPVVHLSLSSVFETTPHFDVSTGWTLDEPPFDADEVAEGESVVSKCDLPQDAGRYCTGWQEYWYHDSDFSSCRRFYYGGCDGNENRFATEEECTTSCLESNRESSTTVFEVDVCLEPKVIGPCTLSEVRWYFDGSEGKCLDFTYGGCHGNRNNFETEKDCLAICIEHLKEVETPEKDVCSLPKDTGPCLADYLRFYWSPADLECRPFTYGGCQGNGNNFVTQEECYKGCGGNEGISQRRIHGPGDCFLPATRGPCKAAMPRWFYDSTHGDCRAFYYGGCHGNRNNFLDYEDCVAYCSKVSYACRVLQCDLECPYGYEQGPDACPLCICMNPCKDVVCPENSRCDVENITCVANPCSTEHKTVCKTASSKPGSCPAINESDHNVVDCVDECKTDEDCWAETKCCRRGGCSAICLLPVQPEEAPVIHSYPETVTAVEHSDVFLDCMARGAPRPQVMWYRDGNPILNDERQARKAIVLANDSLSIMNIEADDAEVSYSCRAYNNIGVDTHTYRLIINVPVKIENEGETEMMEIVRRSNVQLRCIASGFPVPSITWTKDGELVFYDTNHRMTDEGLLISDVDLTDAGSYVCRADNDIGIAKEKLYWINVLDLMSVQIVTEKTNVTAGDNVKLQCNGYGDSKDVNITWLFDGKPLGSEFRFKVLTIGKLLIESIKPSDGGEYTCSATRGHEQSSASVFINIHARKLPEECVDKPWYANCELIVEAGLCHHPYFSIFCCSTCHKVGLLP